MTPKQDWEKEFDEVWLSSLVDSSNNRGDKVKDFIRFLLSQREEEVKEAYKGETKRVWYQKGYEEAKEEVKRELREAVRVMKIPIKHRVNPDYQEGVYEGIDRTIECVLYLLAGKGKNTFEEYMEEVVREKSELRERLRKAAEALAGKGEEK